MTHAFVTVAVQIALGLLTGNWWVGGVAAAAVYAGREHAQAEYRWIESWGSGHRINMPWYGGFQPRSWNKKSIKDVIYPVFAAIIIFYIVRAIGV